MYDLLSLLCAFGMRTEHQEWKLSLSLAHLDVFWKEDMSSYYRIGGRSAEECVSERGHYTEAGAGLYDPVLLIFIKLKRRSSGLDIAKVERGRVPW